MAALDRKSDTFRSRDGYEIDESDDFWTISRNQTLDLSGFRSIVSPGIFESTRKVAKLLCKTKSDAHAAATIQRALHYARWHFSEYGVLVSFDPTRISNYKISLGKEKEHYVGRLRIFLDLWDDLSLPNLHPRLFNVISEWRLAGNAKGEAIALQDPHQGPFNDFEFESLDQSLTTMFHHRDVSLKGDARTPLIRESLDERLEFAKELSATADQAATEGSDGGDPWSLIQKLTVERLRELANIMESDEIPEGSIVRLGRAEMFTSIQRALAKRGVNMVEAQHRYQVDGRLRLGGPSQ